MRIKAFLTTLLCSIAFIAFSQKDCGTTIDEQSTTYSFVQKNRSNPPTYLRNSIIEVPVKIHIISTEFGSLGIDSALVFEELALTNEEFLEIGIEFVQCGYINYIEDNDYVTFVKNDDEGLCDIHDKPESINIYFAPNLERSDGSSLCGYAYNFDIKPRVFMDNGCSSNGSTLTHELGHAFSLLHTHTTSNGDEHANGTNCSIAGDLLCDTPADPKLSDDLVNNNCEYIGTELDNQGTAYDPDPENIMSYSRKHCRVHFSPQQLQQMEDYFFDEGSFLECLPDLPPTSAPNLTMQAVVDVFPNPTISSIFVKNVPTGSTYEIFDVFGKSIFQMETLTTYENFEIKNLEYTPSGIYFLKIKNGRSFSTHKILKQ